MYSIKNSSCIMNLTVKIVIALLFSSVVLVNQNLKVILVDDFMILF